MGETVVIRNGRLLDPGNGIDAVADVWIEDGAMRAVGAGLQTPEGTPSLDASDMLVTPGWIDSHVHFREPGFEAKETLASGSAAAAAGGFTSVATMPNTEPPPDSAAALADLRARSAGACVRIYPIACVTAGRAGKRLAPLADLAASGAVAFSDDGDPVADAGLMEAALAVSRQTGVPLFPHEEVKELTAGGCMHEGAVSRRLGVQGMPSAGEEEMIARDIGLVERCGGYLHVAHISTSGSASLIQEAKGRGLAVTCEVLPHHFALTNEAVADQGTAAKMSPPLRGKSDVEAMLAGLRDGTIDTIATDHAPHSTAEKQLPLTEAPFGIVGLETAVGLTFTYLVETGVLGLAQAIVKWTTEPARILRLPGGRLDIGAPGDVTVIDPVRRWTVKPEHFRSKSCNTPFAGCRLTGKAVATIVGGRVVHNEISERKEG